MRIEEIKNKFLSINKTDFPGSLAHMEMTPYKKELVLNYENPRLSAVMVLLYLNEGQIEILLLKRSDYQGVHSSQVSFPGGKMDESDINLEHTAIRELNEETGIEKQEIEIIGNLSSMYIPPSNFLVHPFISIAHHKPNIKLNERESQYHFGIRLKDLLSDEFLSEKDIVTSYGKIKNVPYFSLNNEVIWGATAAILNELKIILKNES